MAEGGSSLQETPAFSAAAVCFVLVLVSIIIEHVLHLIGHWLQHRNKIRLYEALEKIKSELMLVGFISLLLTVSEDSITKIRIDANVAESWSPCKGKKPNHNQRKLLSGPEFSHHDGSFRRMLAGESPENETFKKMRHWEEWEKEARTTERQSSHDQRRFRYARETSFGRRHLNCWTTNPVLLRIMCFFRQFFSSVPKLDYLTLRHGFVTKHLAPQNEANFDFQSYINRSLEEDFKVVVGISPTIWFAAVLSLLFNKYEFHHSLWIPAIPVLVLLLVGTKLQVIIARMALRIQERGEIVIGAPVVQLDDFLFWFNSPRLLLYLINFVLFQNAFQLAFYVYTWKKFGIKSCFHRPTVDKIIIVCMGALVIILCSYVTLPLYALVTQMGSTMRPTVFSEKVGSALKKWHITARNHRKRHQDTFHFDLLSAQGHHDYHQASSSGEPNSDGGTKPLEAAESAVHSMAPSSSDRSRALHEHNGSHDEIGSVELASRNPEFVRLSQSSV